MSDAVKDIQTELKKFLGRYGDATDAQSSTAAMYDPQIKNLSFALAVTIDSSPQGIVLGVCRRLVLPYTPASIRDLG